MELQPQIIEHMEQELAFTRQHLQQTIEQMQTTVEELKSANEELQSTNEELQSTNEESNTAKEEMQALNEELMTVNVQARAKTEELTELNNDINNLLNSSEIATLFLSNNLHIKSFTPFVTQIIPLVQSDIGRPITNLNFNLKYEHLVEDVKDVLTRLAPKEIKVESTGRKVYLLRIVPYRTLDNFIGGVVLSFRDITQLKSLQSQLQANQDYAKDMLDTLDNAALVIDKQFQIVSVNPAFLELFHLDEGQLMGRLIYKLGNGKWNRPELLEWLEATLEGYQVQEHFPMEPPYGSIDPQPLKLRA
jgi:two-component system CheB/CheR fusion protein